MTTKVPARPRLLLVEDDLDVRETTCLLLERNGFVVHTAGDAEHGLAEAVARRPDLAVVDIGLPGRDGIELTRVLHRDLGCAVVLLTARDRPADEVVGFEAGADDYVTKPFDVAVLVARINAVLRRLSGTPGDSSSEEHSGLDLDPSRYTATWRGRTARLTRTEFELLTDLAAQRGGVLSRGQLLERVWGEVQWGGGHVVEVNVQRIRSKLGADVIVTERGLGYRLP